MKTVREGRRALKTTQLRLESFWMIRGEGPSRAVNRNTKGAGGLLKKEGSSKGTHNGSLI